ncbi:pfkB family kinase [Colletotrichum asianum]
MAPPGSTPINPSTVIPGLVSFGPLVLDEVVFSDGRILSNMPGGTGLYAILGGRIVVPPAQSALVGFLVVAGNDGINLGVHRRTDVPSTRGRLQYHDSSFGRKTFAFTTTPLHPTPEDLTINGGSLLRASAFHTLATPEKLESLIASLQQTRGRLNISGRPRLVWEPAPFACKSENLNAHLQACKLVNVFSPNHLEMLSLVGADQPGGQPFSRHQIETAAMRFLNAGIGPDGTGAVVVRCGEHGSLAVSRSYQARWFPAFHDRTPHRVVDATGAGNAFLGGFTIGLHVSGGLTEAVVRGSVAASFVIEQFGLPQRTVNGAAELWNGESASTRIRQYRQRIGQA